MIALMKRDFYQLKHSYALGLGILLFSQMNFLLSLFNGDVDMDNLIFFTLICGILFASNGFSSYLVDLNTDFDEYIKTMPISLDDYGTSKILSSVMPTVIVISLVMIVFKLKTDIAINVFLLWAILVLISLDIGIGALTILVKFGSRSTIAKNILMVFFAILLFSFFGGLLTENNVIKITNLYTLAIVMAVFVIVLLLFKKVWNYEMRAD
ncbi:hypothetical protein ABID14_001978 [Peptoniphilus olsenii]|uniref:ABC-2 family transporter protein n=1 Tax=Peptoniphilus olsenii TaxID=411570 RepID=A0ABV2JF06_9FIRM